MAKSFIVTHRMQYVGESKLYFWFINIEPGLARCDRNILQEDVVRPNLEILRGKLTNNQDYLRELLSRIQYVNLVLYSRVLK